MRVLVIGGFGHIGRFLVPKLVGDGCEVVVVTRGRKDQPDKPAWDRLNVRHVQISYDGLAGSAEGRKLLAQIGPRVVIDILGIDAPALVSVLPSTVEHVVICGSLWRYGRPRQVPTPEKTQGRCPFEPYRRRYEQLCELLKRSNGPIVSAVMPSNIAGPGKVPLEPHAGRDVAVHRAMAAGEPVVLPGDGNTLVEPADAEDIAEVFRLVLANPDRAGGQMYNAAGAYAVTFNRLVEVYGQIYGRKLAAEHVDWPTFESRFGADESVRYHHQQHMCADISKARMELDYCPRYSPEQTLERAVDWMRRQGLLNES